MKKIALLLISIILACVFCFGVSADYLSTKDIYPIDEYGKNALVLLNNGYLLYGETEKREPVIIAENVNEVTFPKSWPADKAIVKYRNDSIALLKYNMTKNVMELENPCAENVMTVIDIPKAETNFDYLYIDKEGNLKGLRYNENILVMTDALSVTYAKDYLYMLRNTGELFRLNCRSNIKNRELLSASAAKISDNVKSFGVSDRDCVYVTKASEFYVKKESAENPIKLASGVSYISNVILDGSNCVYLTDNGNVFMYRLKGEKVYDGDYSIKLGENAKKVYVRNSTVYYIDQQDKGYVVSINEKNIVTQTLYTENVAKFFPEILDLCVNTNGQLFGATKYNTDIVLYDVHDIANIKAANKNQKWFILKNNGELLIADGGQRSLTNIRYAPICDRRTKLFMYGKEVHLKSPVQIVNERSMYPLRECMEMLGAEILWDDVIKTAIAKLDGKRVEFPVGKKEYVANGQRIVVDDIAAYVDTSVNLTFVPIRYAAEALGFTVGWEQGVTYNAITISK